MFCTEANYGMTSGRRMSKLSMSFNASLANMQRTFQNRQDQTCVNNFWTPGYSIWNWQTKTAILWSSMFDGHKHSHQENLSQPTVHIHLLVETQTSWCHRFVLQMQPLNAHLLLPTKRNVPFQTWREKIVNQSIMDYSLAARADRMHSNSDLLSSDVL